MPYLGLGLGMQRVRSLFRGLLDQFDGAAAAYSLRKLSSDTTNVVRVRRSSDDTEQDFTAAQVSDGSLVDWVNTDVVTISSDFSSGKDSFLAASNCSVTGNVDGILGEDDVLQATATSSGGKRWTRNNTLSVGGSFVVRFRAYAPPTNPAVTHIVEASGAATGSTLVNISSGWTNVEWLFDDFAGNFNNRFIITMADAGGEYTPASTTDVVYIKDVVVTQTKADGFVTTWYDQSGNGRDATQATTTAQPQIVASGALINGGIKLNGSSTGLNLSPFTQSFSGLSSIVVGRTNTTGVLLGLGATPRWYFPRTLSSVEYWGYNDSAVKINGGASVSREELFTGISGATTATFYRDGSSVGTAASTSSNTGLINIGVGGGLYADGWVNEIIIYPSDISADRTDIETNIADYYGITLP